MLGRQTTQLTYDLQHTPKNDFPVVLYTLRDTTTAGREGDGEGEIRSVLCISMMSSFVSEMSEEEEKKPDIQLEEYQVCFLPFFSFRFWRVCSLFFSFLRDTFNLPVIMMISLLFLISINTNGTFDTILR